MLNKTKGRAVWANRVQVDKKKYPKIISRVLKQHKSISIIEGEVVEVKTRGAQVASVILRGGDEISCSSVVVTCGTFLSGLIHIGEKSFPAGRMGDKPSIGLPESL